MVPDIAKKGHSFKGAFAYYLHDKRQDGEQARSTSERVAWTEVRNLAVEDPRIAQRIMIATAQRADELKAAAGVKASGRKSTQHVYAFALSWHPHEAGGLDRAEMVRAADGALAALKADHLQAVIVCHADTRHPHVHVIVNRVDPATGRMHGFSQDRETLSTWAAQYERARGVIVTPARQEKDQERRKRAQEARERPSAPLPPSPPTPSPKPLQRAPDAKARVAKAVLAERQAAQKARHKEEWRAFTARSRARTSAIYDEAKTAMQDAAARHKADSRPGWAAYFREERKARSAFARREATLTGIVFNAIALTAHRPIRGDGSDRGALSMAFNYILDRDARARAFEAELSRAKEAASSRLKAPLDATMRTIRAQRAAALDQARKATLAERAGMIARQDAESAQMRAAWRALYADLDQAKGLDGPSKGKARYAGRPLERQPMKSTFNRSAGAAPTSQATVRTETRSVATPAHAPTPAGVPGLQARTVRPVPTVEPGPAHAAKIEKAAPDSLRRAFPKGPTPSAAPEAKPTPSPPAKDWMKAVMKAPEAKPERGQERPRAPSRGRARDEPERER